MARLSSSSQGVTKTIDPRSAGKAGFVQAYAGATAPSGWAVCDGSAVSRTDYAQLFANIGTKYGVGDGSTTFNLPDGPRYTFQLQLDVSTNPSHTIPQFIGYAYQRADGQWRLIFNINANGGGSATMHTITVAGVTFKGPSAQAVTVRSNSGVTSSAYAVNGTSNIIAVYSSASSYADISGDVALDGKPTDAFVGADSRFSTFDEALESQTIIKLYDDSTTAVSVSVAEATADTAGVVKKNRWQQKTLGSDATDNAGLADLEFTGLEVGKHYEIKLALKSVATTSDSGFGVTVSNGGSTILALHAGGWLASTSNPVAKFFESAVFKATATDITIVGNSFSATSYVTALQTYSQLIERNDLDGEVAIW